MLTEFLLSPGRIHQNLQSTNRIIYIYASNTPEQWTNFACAWVTSPGFRVAHPMAHVAQGTRYDEGDTAVVTHRDVQLFSGSDQHLVVCRGWRLCIVVTVLSKSFNTHEFVEGPFEN
jgi:hypothetical protein